MLCQPASQSTRRIVRIDFRLMFVCFFLSFQHCSTVFFFFLHPIFKAKGFDNFHTYTPCSKTQAKYVCEQHMHDHGNLKFHCKTFIRLLVITNFKYFIQNQVKPILKYRRNFCIQISVLFFLSLGFFLFGLLESLSQSILIWREILYTNTTLPPRLDLNTMSLNAFSNSLQLDYLHSCIRLLSHQHPYHVHLFVYLFICMQYYVMHIFHIC